MKIELRVKNLQHLRMLERIYDPELDTIVSVLSDACKATSQNTEFIVSGFGQERWPVDSSTDLPVFLEQLPDALQSIRSGDSFAIEFYEQGVERTISFAPVAQGYLASCLSGTDWIPNPDREEISRKRLESMLTDVQGAFMEMLRVVAPRLVGHPWIVEWLTGKNF